jgi:hypothetical protein
MTNRKQEKSKKNPRKNPRKSDATSGDWKTPPLIAGS